MQYASASYLGFVDSDDWVAITMFEKLYQAAIHYQTDMTGCLALRAIDETKVGSVITIEPVLSHYESDEEKKSLMKNGIHGYIVCWIYRRELIIGNQVFFPEFVAYEDNYWRDLVKLYLHSSVLLQEELYYYYVNPNSTTMSCNCLSYMDRLTIEEKKLSAYRELGIFELYYPEIEYRFVQFFFIKTVYMVVSRCYDFSLSMFLHMKRQLFQLFPKFKVNKYLISELHPLEQTFLAMADCDYTQENLNLVVEQFQKEYEKTRKRLTIEE
jgi:hypothetical protein